MSYIPDSGSVSAVQGTTPWVINQPSPSIVAYQAAGSILAVSGTFSSSPQSSIIATQIAGSVLAVNMPSPSLIAYQLAGSIMAVSGSFTSNPQGSITALQLAGSILAVNMPSPSVISYQLAGSIMQVTGGGGGTQYLENTQAASVTGTALMFKSNMTTSILTVVTPATPLPASVQGTVGASMIGLTPVNVGTPFTAADGASPNALSFQGATTQGYAAAIPFLFNGASYDRMRNITYRENSVATASVFGVPVLFKFDETNSVLTAVSPQHPFPIQGSITALQGTNPWVINMPSPSVVVIHPGGSVVQVRTDNASVVAVLSNSSVTALQGTNPWVVNVPTSSYISYQLAGSIMAVSATVNTGNSSVQLLGGVAVIGSVATLQGTNPWLIGNSSVLAFQGTTPWTVNSILGTYQEKNATVASALGQVMLFKNNATTSTLATVSTIDPLPIIGSVAVLQGTNPFQVNLVTPSLLSIQPGGSVMNVNVSGSVATVSATGNSSVQLISTSASIATLVNNILTGNSSVQLISTSASIMVNNKAIFGANNSWTQSDSVISIGWLRNDTMSSVTTADLKYSAGIVGPIGENIVANSPITKWIQGTNSVFTGTSVQVLAAQGTSIFTYITGIQMINPSANNAYVTFTQGIGAAGGSTIGWGIVPANGGTNMTFPNPLRTLDNRGVSASVNAVASIYIMAQGFISKT